MTLGSAAALGCGEPGGEASDALPVPGATTTGPTNEGNGEGCHARSYVSVLAADAAAPGTTVDELEADAVGGAWVAGRLVGGASFGGVPFASQGGADAFVARLDPCGRARWARPYGGGGEETFHDLAVDGQGNAYLLGSFDGTVDFGTGPVTGEGRGRDAFLLKLGPRGDIAWWKHVETLDGGAYVADLAVDAEGGVLLLGHLEGEVSLGDAGVQSSTVTGFAAKIAPTGHTAWASRLGTYADWEPLAIEAAPGGGAFVAGEDARGVGLFALAVTAEGGVAWTKSFRTPGQFEESFFDLTVANDGRPIVSGRGFFAQGVPPGAEPPYFVAKLGEGGEPAWVAFRETPAHQVGGRPDGSLVAAGHVCDDVSLPEPASCVVAVSNVAADGAEVDTRLLRGDAVASALDVETSGRPLLAGAFEGRLRIDGAQAAGRRGDQYVARLLR
ncbi:MAG TPA: hypothetical protein VFS43_08735 [Polyangiaceae bacterium]|nr:hypothetical protein [Polyangiaceae bacterium]